MAAPTYIELEAFKTAVGETGTAKDGDINRAIGAASRAVDSEAGRRFYLDPSETTRKYTARNSCLVVIDDVTSITSVTSEGSAVDTSLWFAEPANAVVDGQPFIYIESDGLFSTKRQAIEVTGVYGWPEVPAPVEQMTMIIAVKLFKRTREAPFGLVQSGSLDGLALRIVREDPDILLLLGDVKRANTV